jgi:Protein of unknown function (DUF4199)
MKIRNTSIWDIGNRISEIYGTLIFLALVVYFFLMYLAGWVHITELRLLNLVILTAGVYFALKQYQRTHRGEMDYFHAFTTGIWTISIGTTAFSIFLLVYLHIDKGFMSMLAEKQPLGFYLNPYIASFIVSLEGFFSGFFVTYLLSNFLADRKPASRLRKHSEIIQ